MSLPNFKDASLLRRALTHRSYLNEHAEALEDNERLEFLGDAVLDFLVGAFLYHRYPEKSEGELTRLRAALVRTEQLAAFAKTLNLNEELRLGKGEEDAGGRARLPLLCAAFEAMIGAYYLDSGIEAVSEYVEPIFLPAAEAVLRDEADTDAKSLLQEWSQAELGLTPFYELVASAGPDHEREFTLEVRLGHEVYGIGTGRNKQVAAQAAARAALQRIGRA
jgi:ribonuclease-3